jgi:hypothetical protein
MSIDDMVFACVLASDLVCSAAILLQNWVGKKGGDYKGASRDHRGLCVALVAARKASPLAQMLFYIVIGFLNRCDFLRIFI